MSNEEMISPKDIYESLWRCRDFELSHLWQRSIFLTAFLVMCFTGYAALLVKGCETPAGNAPGLSSVVPCMATLVALLGFVFSILWIKMAKGSKAWYERYENAITRIERNEKYSLEIVRKDMDKDKVMHGSLPSPNEPDDCLFTTNAGRYSVSRINIVIGQVFMIVWIVLYAVSAGLVLSCIRFEGYGLDACTSAFRICAGASFLLLLVLVGWAVGRPAFAHRK